MMKQAELWRPTKYVIVSDRLRASRDPKEVGIGSRLIADLIATRYQNAIPQYVRGRLLDLGCGKAPLYDIYNKHATESVCVDWENSVHENVHLDFHCDLTQMLPIEDASFDTIILSDVLEHIPEPERLCQEMQRTLRPNGHLIMNVPFYYWLHEEPFDFYRYTEHALRRFLTRANFEVISLEAVGGAPEIFADMLAKLIVKVPVVGSPIARLTQWFVLQLRRTQLGLRFSQRTSKKFPLGYFVVAKKLSLASKN